MAVLLSGRLASFWARSVLMFHAAMLMGLAVGFRLRYPVRTQGFFAPSAPFPVCPLPWAVVPELLGTEGDCCFVLLIVLEHTGITPGRRLGGEKDAPVPQSRAHQREQPEEPVGCLRGLLIRGARRLPPGLFDVRSPTGCLSIILYERGYSNCIRGIGERVPRPGPQCASDGVSSVSADCTKVFRQ
ncbi:hypothetical protein ACOMHN_017240 [Nucella lapillus]